MSLELSGTTPAIKGVAGSVSAPAITGDDGNTGISFPAADTIKFSTNGVERMAITNSGITGITSGITMTDIWYVSSSFAGSANPIASNWSQYTLHNSGSIGGSMTQNSGIFTFPEPGIYRISWWIQAFRGGGAVNYSKVMLETTTNNSSYSTIPSGYTSFNSNSDAGNWYGTMSAEHFVDISDVSNTKVRFQAEQETSGSTMEQVFVYFIRLGDT